MSHFAFFCIIKTNWSTTICWKCLVFPTGWFWLLLQRSSDHRRVSLFQCLQFYSIGLPACLCTNTIQALSLLLWNMFWGQGWWSPKSSDVVENSFWYPGFFVIPCLLSPSRRFLPKPTDVTVWFHILADPGDECKPLSDHSVLNWTVDTLLIWKWHHTLLSGLVFRPFLDSWNR